MMSIYVNFLKEAYLLCLRCCDKRFFNKYRKIMNLDCICFLLMRYLCQSI